MVQNDEYIDFDLKALFFYILRQWKPVVVFCLTLALLLGCFQAYQEYKTSLHLDTESSYWAEYQQYQDEIVFMEDRVSTIQNHIDVMQDYIQNSVLMNADHRNIYIAKTSYYIDSGYKIIPENTYQDLDKTLTLVWLYGNHMEDTTVFEKIGAQVGIEAKYLMELVEVSIPNDSTLSISVSHPSQQTAGTIMNIIQEELQSVHRQLADTVTEHTITQIMNTCGVYIDEALNKTQKETYDELLDLQDDLIIYREKLLALKEGPAPGELNIVTAFIKWFILGGGVAGVLTVAYLFIRSILRNRLHASSQLVSSFRSTVLGEVICSRTKLSPVFRTLNHLEGCLTENSEGNLQFLAENIRNHAGTAEIILLCGDGDPALCTGLAESLNKHLSGIRLVSAGDILKDAHALRALAECDAVVMVAARDRSKNSSLSKMLNLIHSYKKEFIGSIMAY